MIELYTLFSLTDDQGQITAMGIIEIKRFIADSKLPALPYDWTWLWLVERGEYRGTFPKRAAAYWRKVHQLKVADAVISQLGNIARAHTEDGVTYHFEFVNRLDWKRGDFGDPHSCLWGTYANGRQAMQDNGVWAVRFYDVSGKGYARAWFYTVTDWHIVWNGYGLMTHVIARIVARFLKLDYKEIDLSNFGDAGGPVFINNSGGWAIGSRERLADIDEYDFEFDVDGLETCYNCGRVLYEDDMYHGPDYEYYCQDCFYRFYQDCYSCGEAFDPSDVTYVESTGEWVCERCLSRWYTDCFECDETIARRNAYPYEGQPYCRNCCDALRPIYQE